MSAEQKPKAGRAWDWAWLAWLVAFLCIEIPSMRFAGGTLSEHTWKWFSLLTHARFYIERRAAFWLFFFALVVLHFGMGVPAWPALIVPAAPFGLVIVVSLAFERKASQ